MKLIIGLLLSAVFLVGVSDSFAQSSHSVNVSFEDDIAASYKIPISNQPVMITQSYSWVQDETSRFNLVSYSIDGESVKISREARGDFSLELSPGQSYNVVFSGVPQYALSVEGTNDFSFLPSSPTNDNWFDEGTDVSVNVQKTSEIEPNKVRQEITGWSLDKTEFWEIEDDGATSFTTPPITMTEYHQIDFFESYQYKLNVLSDSGTTFGSGWYEQGETVEIGVDGGSDGLVMNSLSGWEGADVISDGGVTQVFIDGPVTVTANLEQNYSLLIGVIIIPILIGGFVVGKKFKGRQTVVVEKTIEKTIESKPEKNYDDEYDQKLSNYLEKQIELKIKEMHESKIISDSKLSKIKNS